MKSQIISQNKFGFIMIEIILAFSLFAVFTISIFSLNLSFRSIKIWSINELNILKNSVREMDQYLNFGIVSNNLSFLNYGNYSKYISNNSFNIIKSDLINSWGASNCSARITFDQFKIKYYPQGIFLGSGNISTDIDVRNSIVYITTDSTIQSQSDFYIIDANDYTNLKIISSLNTGPGLTALTIAGPYAYVVNTSSISQLQIIDIHNRENPFILSQLKIPLPTATTTAPRANSIFYKNGYIYLGTYKWDGPELFIVDVRIPSNPIIVGSFKTNTLINSIYVNDNTAYIATSDIYQMRILDVYDKTDPKLIYTFSATGWQTQEGKTLDYFENILSLGRTVGGFNNIYNHEVYIFSTSTYNEYISHDIPGGIYGILMRQPYIYLITHNLNSEFQIWNSNLNMKIYEKSLGIELVKMSCDYSNLYFATGNERGLSILTL